MERDDTVAADKEALGVAKTAGMAEIRGPGPADDATKLDSHSDTIAVSETVLRDPRSIPAPSDVTGSDDLSDAELSYAARSDVALLHAERQRTKRIAPIMIVLAAIAAGGLPLFGGTPWAKHLFYATLAAGSGTMAYLWFLASRPERFNLRMTPVAWTAAFSATCANTIYFGVYSPAPVLMVVAVVVVAQGQSVRLATTLYLVAAGVQGIVPLLDGLGILADPGLLQASTLAPLEKLVGQCMMQAIILGAFLVGRSVRVSSTEALERAREAMRALAQREALAHEARENFRRAMNIGGAGRLSGITLGNYSLSDVIGYGGMGEIYRAQHMQLKTPAAVKVVHQHLASDPTLVERFLREAKTCATFDSDRIVRIFDAGVSEHGPFLAMELLTGQSLSDRLETGGILRPSELLRLAQHVGQGLDTAAEGGIVHRDIKPQNLFLVGAESSSELEQAAWNAKILDFGIARVMAGGATLTRGDVVLGTPAYMAPEQVQGLPADRRSDLFALCSVLYRCATGFAPFAGENAQAVLYAVVHHEPEAASSRSVMPPSMDPFFQRGFAKDPAKRYQSGDELARALAEAMGK